MKRSLWTLALICAGNVLIFPADVHCEDKPDQRTFSQAPAVVEKAVRSLQSSASGPLPTLDGFATPGDIALDQFKRGYYQCVAKVIATPTGASEVKVTAKITAWYASSEPANAGYRTLPSNGRLESDFLDRLSDALTAKANVSVANANPPRSPAKKVDSNEPTLSAPMPQGSDSSSVFHGRSSSKQPAKVDAGSQNQQLAQEAKGLEEILRNQSHPNNLAAVKEPGTPVLVSPNLGAKVMFQAAAEDEFEVLDMNANWVHVRISGLSRGWIRRSSLELPDTESSADNAAPVPVAPADGKESPFQIENEEIASFPAEWEPLRGKTVKIVSLQPHGTSVQIGSAGKLAFAKTLLEKEYTNLKQSSSTAAGVVLIFDSADGGMLAATMPVLQQWKAGTLSDEALWRRCYFDPPELSGREQP